MNLPDMRPERAYIAFARRALGKVKDGAVIACDTSRERLTRHLRRWFAAQDYEVRIYKRSPK